MVGVETFKTKKALGEYVKQQIYSIPLNTVITGGDMLDFLLELVKRHPEYNEKMANFKHFIVLPNKLNFNARELNIITSSNDAIAISLKTCVSGLNTSNKQLYKTALRNSINKQIQEYKKSLSSNDYYCSLCSCVCIDNNHIDHYEPDFKDILIEFNDKFSFSPPVKYAKGYANQVIFTQDDRLIQDKFYEFHKEKAKLRVLCISCNLTRD